MNTQERRHRSLGKQYKWGCYFALMYLLYDAYITWISLGSNSNTLNELPFYDLNLDEFLKATGSLVFSAIDRLLDKKDLFKDALESPNRGDDSYNCDRFIESKYCSVKQAGIHFDQAKKQNGFSILYCNMRRLTKNLSFTRHSSYHERNSECNCYFWNKVERK